MIDVMAITQSWEISLFAIMRNLVNEIAASKLHTYINNFAPFSSS